MANVVFGYKNLLLESGVTFVESSQAAAHPVENLAKAHPESFWRISTLTGQQNVAVTFPGVRGYDLIAPLYATASPHQNLLKNGHTLDTTDGWTSSVGAGSTLQSSVVTGLEVPEVRLEAAEVGAGSVFQAITQAWTRAVSGTWTLTISAYVSTANVEGSANARLEILTDVSHGASVDIDLSDGSVNSSSATGDYAIVTATSTLHSGTWYRVQLTVTPKLEGDVTARLAILNSSFTALYTGGGEAYRIGGVTMELGSSPGAAILGRTGKASFFATTNSFNSDDLIPLSISRAADDWSESNGWVNGYTRLANRTYSSSIAPYFYDPHNTDSQLDISNLYIGPEWQPTANLDEDWSLTANPDTDGRSRILRGTISQLSEADAMGEGYQMMLAAGVGSRYSAIADGGQEYRSNRKFVLVILDPDEATYQQEQMIYGYLDRFELVNLPRGRKRLEFQVTEVLP